MSYSMVPRPRRVYSNGQLILITLVALLVLIGSGLLVYSSITARMDAANTEGTATALANASHIAFAQTGTAFSNDQATTQAQLKSTAQAYLTATALANATATANANATATAAAEATVLAAARATSIAEANATATAQANRNPYPPYTGTMALDDPLYNNNQGHGWDAYSLPVDANCRFNGSGYESTLQNENGTFLDISNVCNAEKTSFSNFAFQADVTILKGECGGLNAKNIKTNDGFQFIICVRASFTNDAGNWAFRAEYGGVYFGDNAHGFSGVIHTGYGQTNVLAVTVVGASLTFYINGQEVASKNWSDYTPCKIGLISAGAPGVLEDVLFRNAKVWTM